jgi:uncharacterized YigZ family protein
MPADSGSYLTVDKNFGPCEIREKGSRFISMLFPVKSELQIDAILGDLRRTYHDATHICWSYRIFHRKAESFRYDDDGEPGGTAGLPIFYEIKGWKYFNVLLAVIRYFGGVKLGTGGLVKAYARAAWEVLNISCPMVNMVRERVSVRFPFGFIGEMRHLIRQFSLEIFKQEFAPDGVRMILGIPISRLKEVEKELMARSRGSVKLTIEPAGTDD